MTKHVALAAGRWGAFTLAEQLAHVGSEVDRAMRDYFLRFAVLARRRSSQGPGAVPRRREH